ncbi:hypothetical protein [Rummeliibacillus sp. SL167]|uniref:hypothetical protein n=1 Tax=Rummeliibacillus sp. SL167 TaxID=2579792 RepID=UPI0011B591C1|nr:hypothetical protein [Rummeliibacillus sp. SL167]
MEPNNISNEAQQIERNNHNPSQTIVGNNTSQKVLVGNVEDSNDVDWYKVNLPANLETILAINPTLGVLKFEVHDEYFNRIFNEEVSKDPNFLGAKPHYVQIQSEGTYYVKVSNAAGASGEYRFTIGSPNYSVASYQYKAVNPLTLTTTIKIATDTYNLSHITEVPEKAVVYKVTFDGTKVNSATSETRKLKLQSDSSWISTASYTWVANVPISSDPSSSLNKKFHSIWSVQLGGNVSSINKTYSLTPKITFSYYYPVLPQ